MAGAVTATTSADGTNMTPQAAEAVAELPPNVRAILVDTKGPEIRTGPLQSNKEIIDIEVGDTVELTILDVSSDPVYPAGSHRVQVDYKSIAKSMKVGGHVLLDDGLIALEVTDVDPNLQYVTCVALNSGPIKKNKGVNLPGVELDLPALTDKDKADLKWACDVGADFVAASFIRTAANVRSVIAFLDRCIAQMAPNKDGKLPLRPLVISKIESKEGVDNFFEILTESDGIMVARGDLGVEVSLVCACVLIDMCVFAFQAYPKMGQPHSNRPLLTNRFCASSILHHAFIPHPSSPLNHTDSLQQGLCSSKDDGDS